MEQGVRFEIFIDPNNWRSLEEHIHRMDDEMAQDVAAVSDQDRLLREQLRAKLLDEYDVRTVSSEKKEWAAETLFSGDVCSVDGTRSIQPLLAGARCRIGVVSVSYRGHRTESVLFVSEQQINPPEANPLDVLRRRGAERAVVSSMVAGAIMTYMERAIALQRPESWRILNGPLVPYELRTGLGALQALEPCLTLAGRIIEATTIAGVIGTSAYPDLASVGFALEPGEYVCMNSLAHDLREYLEGSPDNGAGARSAAKFSDRDRQRFRRFIDQFGNQVEIGIMRAGARPYVFQAHHGVFHDVAALLMVDASFQPLRAYPLLVDYADSLCTRIFAGGDFRRQMEMKLAKAGVFETELPEQLFRRR